MLNNAALGTLEKVIAGIGAVHEAEGKADPVLSPVVIAALDTVLPPIEPPNWPKERKADFSRLDRGLQSFIVAHERQIIIEMRNAQNAAALARKENHEQESIPAAGTDRTDRHYRRACNSALTNCTLILTLTSIRSWPKDAGCGVPTVRLRHDLMTRAGWCHCAAVAQHPER